MEQNKNNEPSQQMKSILNEYISSQLNALWDQLFEKEDENNTHVVINAHVVEGDKEILTFKDQSYSDCCIVGLKKDDACKEEGVIEVKVMGSMDPVKAGLFATSFIESLRKSFSNPLEKMIFEESLSVSSEKVEDISLGKESEQI